MCRLIPWVVDGAAALEAKNSLGHNDNGNLFSEWAWSCACEEKDWWLSKRLKIKDASHHTQLKCKLLIPF